MPTFKRWKGKRIDSTHPHYSEARWWVEFRINHKRILKAIPEARTQKEADHAERKISHDLFENKYESGKGTGFSTYFRDSYLLWSLLEKSSYRDDVSRGQELTSFFGDRPIRSIETADCQRLKYLLMKGKNRKGELRSGATVNKYMALLSGIFTKAIEDRVIDSTPLRGIKREEEGDGRERWLSADEYRRLLAVLVDDLAYLRRPTEVALGTGLRKGELLNITIERVNLSNAVKHVLVQRHTVEIPPDCLMIPKAPRTKEKYTRIIPLNENTRSALVQVIGQRPPGECVFSKEAAGVNLYSLRKGFPIACERAEIVYGIDQAGGTIFHDTRRCFATRLRANGVHEYDIKYLLGHAIDKGVTKTYARQSLDSLRRAINTLNDEQWGKVIPFEKVKAG